MRRALCGAVAPNPVVGTAWQGSCEKPLEFDFEKNCGMFVCINLTNIPGK